MDRKTYELLEGYMRACVHDRAHDENHVLRVLYNALEIAETESVDMDVLVAACLLHDVARREEAENPAVRHAPAGAVKAQAFLLENGFDEAFARRVADCIAVHSFGSGKSPEKIEEKILFDADKLDATGATGTLRMLLYHGQAGDPLYMVDTDGQVSDGKHDTVCNYFYEYHGMIARIEESMLTKKGRELARQRAQTARDMYERALSEVRRSHMDGKMRLDRIIR